MWRLKLVNPSAAALFSSSELVSLLVGICGLLIYVSPSRLIVTLFITVLAKRNKAQLFQGDLARFY